MKRQLLLISFAFSFFCAVAQEGGTSSDGQLRSKRGYAILPEAGDFGIGFNAVPFLEYAGNIFNADDNNTVRANFQNANQQLVGKYFLDKNTAIRGRFRFGVSSDTDKNLVAQDGSSDPAAKVEDERKISNNVFSLGAGLEKRRGNGRLYGIYGGEISITLRSNKETYTYGNSFRDDNQTPTTTIPVAGEFNTVTNVAQRTLESKTGGSTSFGLGGFAGVEYFFAPKIAVSAEFTYGLQVTGMKDGESTTESWDAANSRVKETTSTVAGGSNFSLDTGNYGGAINLFFYF